MSEPAAGGDSSFALLERRRRLTLWWAFGAFGVGLLCWPVGLLGEEGDETREMIALLRGHPDIRHIDGERRGRVEAALTSDAFQIAAFQTSGLAEPFARANIGHVIAGQAQGVPFALAQLSLLDQKGYRVFGGVLASFRLPRPRPGLTVVSRDRGLLGNVIARTGSAVERVALEDPHFEAARPRIFLI